MTRLPFLLASTALLLILAVFIPVFIGAAPPGDPIFGRHQDYAEAHNAWAKHIAALSPASPDYQARVREEWQRRELSEKFRRLEAALQPH